MYIVPFSISIQIIFIYLIFFLIKQQNNSKIVKYKKIRL